MNQKLIAGILIFLSFSLSAQKSDVLLDHYNNELKTLNEFIQYSKIIKGDTNIDVKFYYLNISIGIESPYVGGEVLCKFEPLINGLNEVVINLNSALTVDDISYPCESYYQDNDLVYISLAEDFNTGDEVELTIFYQGVPALAGGYKGMRYETHGASEPIIATLSTPYLAHYWYPCKDGPEDKPDSVYVDITIPDEEINGVGLMGISNGVLENVIDNGDTKTFQWRHRYPVVTYYVMAAVSNYVHFEDVFNGSGGESFPLDYYVFQEDLSSSQAGVQDLPDVIQVFSDVFGTYPFSNEKYGMTQLGFYGAIENQTNTIQNNLSGGWFDVSIHELGHMWFGDMITCSDWHHGWLNEGFATYSEAVWYEHTGGMEAYHANMSQNEFWNAGTLYLQNAQDTFNTFPSIIYSKGAYTVHMLRGVLGDDHFFEGLTNYTHHPDFMYKNATTDDLKEVFEDVSGLDLEFFFEQWIYDERWPFYYYNYQQNPVNDLYLVIHQAQEELYGYRPVFEMPVQVKLNFEGGGDTTVVFWNDQQTQTFYINPGQEVSSVEIDPEKWILRKEAFDPGIPVSINTYDSEPLISVYPNPVDDILSVFIESQTTKHFEIRIYDLKGRLIKSQLILSGQENSIDLTEIQTGVYLYNIRDKNNSLIRNGKILKNKI